MNGKRSQNNKDQRPLVLIAIGLFVLILHATGGILRHLENVSQKNRRNLTTNYIWLKGGELSEGIYHFSGPVELESLYQQAQLSPPPRSMSSSTLTPVPFSAIILRSGKTPRQLGLEPRVAALFNLPIPINRADADTLTVAKGIGPRLAQRILELRKRRGGLEGLPDLMLVKGIGPKKLKKLEGLFSFEAAPEIES